MALTRWRGNAVSTPQRRSPNRFPRRRVGTRKNARTGVQGVPCTTKVRALRYGIDTNSGRRLEQTLAFSLEIYLKTSYNLTIMQNILKKIHRFSGILFMLTLSQIALAVEDCDYATDLLFHAYHLYEQGGEFSQQKLLFYKSLQLCANQPDVHNTLSAIFKQQGKYSKAVYHYKQSLKLRPDFSHTWDGLGETYYKQKRFPLSVEAYSHTCQINKDSKRQIITVLRNKGVAITNKDDIIDKENLLVLYDTQRRKAINQRLLNCGLRGTEVRPIQIFFNLYFDSKKTVLRAGTKQQLDEIAAALQEINFLQVIIHGHTDVRGFADLSVVESKQRNLQLSKERATAIANALIQRGISKKLVKIYGHGSRNLLVRGTTLEALAKNRRTEIEVKPVKPSED